MMRHWTLTEAKARLGALIEQARVSGPQTITEHGRVAAILISPKAWDRVTNRQGNLAEFFAASPLRGSGLQIRRENSRLRTCDL